MLCTRSTSTRLMDGSGRVSQAAVRFGPSGEGRLHHRGRQLPRTIDRGVGLGFAGGVGSARLRDRTSWPFTGVSGKRFGPTDRWHFMRGIAGSGLSHLIRLINVGSDFLGEKWPQPVALLWIDGDYRYEAVARDFALWQPKLASGGIIIFNNANQASSGPGRLVGELLATNGFDQVWSSGKLVGLQVQRREMGQGLSLPASEKTWTASLRPA